MSATNVDDRSEAREIICRGDGLSDESNKRAHGIVEHPPFVLVLLPVRPCIHSMQMVERRLAGCNAMVELSPVPIHPAAEDRPGTQ